MKFSVTTGKVKRFEIDGQQYDCTNGGISATRNDFYVLYNCTHDEAIEMAQVYGWRSDECLWLEPTYGILRAMPMIDKPKGMVGPMSGGNKIVCQINGIECALPILDRYETPEQYEALSM